MSISWCRLWHDMPTDPKFRAVAKRAGRPTAEVLALFTAMLANASANDDERGSLWNWCHEDMACALDMEPEHAEAIYEAMQGKLLDGNRLMGWERRQPKREDNSTERVRAYRERKRADETRRNARETHCNAPDIEIDIDTDLKEERNTSVCHTPDAERATGQTDDPNFDKCRLAFNGSTGRIIDELKNSEGPYGTKARAAAWLADTLDDYGADAILDAFRFLERCRGNGQSIRDPRSFITKNAQRSRENTAAKKAAEAEKKSKLKPIINRMTGEIEWRKPFEPYVSGNA